MPDQPPSLISPTRGTSGGASGAGAAPLPTFHTPSKRQAKHVSHSIASDDNDDDVNPTSSILPTVKRPREYVQQQSGPKFDYNVIQLEMDSPQLSHSEVHLIGSDGDNNHIAHATQLPPWDGANTMHMNQYTTALFNRLRTDLYDRLRTKLYIELHGKFSYEHYHRLYVEYYRQLSNELYLQLVYELAQKLPFEPFQKLAKELHLYVSDHPSGGLYLELHTKLYVDLYNRHLNPFSIQTTDSMEDYDLVYNQSSSMSSFTSQLSSIPVSKDQDEDGHHHQQQQQHQQERAQGRREGQQEHQEQQDRQGQEQETHENGSSTDTNVPPQPLSSFTITSQNGQFDIPLLGDITKLHPRSCDATPFALHMMLLGVLANNPNILLPLASLKKCFFDHIHMLNEECFREHHVPAGCNKTVIKMVIGVTCTRLKYAIGCLYPPNKEEDPWTRVIPELEEEGCPILEYIIRDSLSVYNPMRVLLSYLRSLTTRYHASSLSTPQEHETFVRNVVLRSDSWIYELKHVCSLYGLYLWDSQWMTNEEWDELAQHMNTFYTKICPYVQDDFAVAEGYASKQLGTDRHCVNRYFKTILRCIASCFAFRYRPMKNPSLLNIPYGWEPDVINVDCSWIEMKAYFHTLRVLPDVLKQCVIQCMTNPTTFHQAPLADSHLEDEYLLTVSNATADAKGYASAQNYIMSELDAALKGAFDGWVPEDAMEDEEIGWTPQVVGFGRTDMAPYMVFLIDCIVKHPPTVDPVYNRIKDGFPKKVNLSNIINNYSLPLPGDPGFTYHESSSSS